MTPDLQNLLDQIEQADALATPGPWEESTNGVTMNDRDMWRIGHPNKPATFNAVMRSGDALFIALSRTAMPALAQAVRAVMDLEDESLDGDLQGYEIDQYVGYNQALRSVREAITDALGADDD